MFVGLIFKLFFTHSYMAKKKQSEKPKLLGAKWKIRYLGDSVSGTGSK